MAKRLIYDLDFEALGAALTELGEPAFRTQQLWEGLYTRFYTDFAQFSNIPKTYATVYLHNLSSTLCMYRKLCSLKTA